MSLDERYATLAGELSHDGLISDPWVDGRPRFAFEPFVLTDAEADRLADAAESVAAVLDELARLVTVDEELLDGFFGLTPVQKLMWQTSAPAWHGFARADVFLRPDGSSVVCEVNCDTPSGFPEAVRLGELAGTAARGCAATAKAVTKRPGFAGTSLFDPNEALPRVFGALVERFLRQLAPEARPRGKATVGIVYPTELTEDLALIELYRRWLDDAGYDVVLGSPFNLLPTEAGGVALFGRRLHAVVRHYKTDWWGERRPIWDDEAAYPDAEPLTRPLATLLRAAIDGQVAIVNPFGAVLPQNKRAFALCWEQRPRFSPAAQAAIEAYVPQTFRLEASDRDRLAREQDLWVLKSDFGCEGEEVLVGKHVPADLWQEALAHALPSRWVAQRRFDVRPDPGGRQANHGVYLVGGLAAGLYTRLSVGPTDGGAVSVPTLVRRKSSMA